MNEIKITKTLAHAFFLFMFVFAAWHFTERVLYADGSFYTFKLLNFEKFNIEAGRYSAFLTQILPLVFIKAGASLKAVMLAYSLSFILVYYLIFLLCLYGFSSLKAGLAATFVLFLGISDCSLYPITELQLGMMSTVLFYAFLEYYFTNQQMFTPLKKALLIIVAAGIVLLCLFSHPSTLFPVLFILFFQILDKKLYTNKAVYILFALVVAVYGLKFLSVDENSYEGQQMSPFKNLFAILADFRHTNSVHFFLKFVLKGVYILPIVLLGITSVFYLWKGEYLKLAYTSLATIGFFVLLMVVFSPGDSDVGMEKNLIPLWFFIAVPFVHDVLSHDFKTGFFRPVLFTVVLIAGLAGFHRATVIYGDRLNYMKEIIEVSTETTQSSKVIIEKKYLNQDRLSSTWSYANETLLLSSLKGPEHAKTLYLIDDPSQLKDFDILSKDVYLCVPFWIYWNYSSLNEDYFKLPDEPYVFLQSSLTGK